jgi:formylglycine-generating enzyme required for sulfatase activity
MKKKTMLLAMCSLTACAHNSQTEHPVAGNVAVDTETQSKENAPKETITVNGVSFEMVKVEAGTFTMGGTPEMEDKFDYAKPVHKVTITRNFYIGETEVTQALWEAVMGSNPSWFEGNANRPVESVTWNDCQTFIKKLNAATGKKFRLPTEAEWEFAARGGNKSRHYRYSGSNDIDEVAWYKANSDYETHDVAMKKPNELGLYDMSGNVSEWCEDWLGEYSASAQTNPTGPKSGIFRVRRGGEKGDEASWCVPSYRYHAEPGESAFCLGFRLAFTE